LANWPPGTKSILARSRLGRKPCLCWKERTVSSAETVRNSRRPIKPFVRGFTILLSARPPEIGKGILFRQVRSTSRERRIDVVDRLHTAASMVWECAIVALAVPASVTSPRNIRRRPSHEEAERPLVIDHSLVLVTSNGDVAQVAGNLKRARGFAAIYGIQSWRRSSNIGRVLVSVRPGPPLRRS